MKPLLRGLFALAVSCALVLTGAPARAQDILGHVIVGYQGWFSNPNDGSPVGALGTGGNDHLNLETYPDMSDYPSTEQFPTSWGNLGDVDPAMMFSSDRTFTASLHAKWMAQNGIDVAAIQRFGEVWPDSGNTYNSQKDQIETKMADALAGVGLKFYVEYDCSSSGSGGWGSNFVSDVEADWQSNQDLDNNQAIWKRSNYAHEGGKPVVELWGIGGNFNSIDTNPSDFLTLVNWFKGQGVYVIAGVPTGWDGGGWSDALSGFTGVYQACNAISPWVVGRFSGASGADSYYNGTLIANNTWCQQNGVAFLPCIYPGTSFHNSNGGTENQIPRLVGTLMWEQFANIRRLGVSQCFVSMFDEMNEATNIMNCAADSRQLPTSTWFLGLNADGTSLSPDFYLRLTSDGGAMIKGNTALQTSAPTAHWTDEPFMDVDGAVPGTVEAENYDFGGQGIAYNTTAGNGSADSYRYDGVDIETTSDTGGGYDMGWTASGQWFNYTVSVATAGTYNVACRVASPSGSSFHIQNSSGANLSGAITVPATGGYQTWSTVNATVTLPAGPQVLTVWQDGGGYNVNNYTFSLTNGTAPSAPTNLTATFGNAQVTLNWTSMSGATSYNVYRGTSAGGESTTPIATGITGTTYTNTGLTNGTQYFYKVAAVNSVGTSGYSNEASATPQVQVPPPPTGLSATAGNTQVSLAWTSISGATSYNVYRGTSSGGESTTPVATGITTTSYTNTGLTDGTTYYFKIAGVNTAGTSSYSNEASATPIAPLTVVDQIDCGSPSAVAPFVADIDFSAGSEFSSTNTINLNGQANAAPAAVYQTVRWNSSFNYTIPGLTANQSYTVRLHFCELTWTAAGQRKFNVAINGTTVLSAFDIFATAGGQNKALVEPFTATANSSGQIVFAFTQGGADNPEIAGLEVLVSGGGSAPSTPTGLTDTGGNGVNTLNWTASSGATSYNVYRGTTTGGEGTTPYATNIQSTAYSDSGLSCGTTYYYKVQAVNSVGTSGLSNEASATPLAATVVTGLSASPGNAAVTLTWTENSSATSYNIYRGTASQGESTTPIASGISQTTTSYTDSGLTNGTKYYYIMKAVNCGGTSGASSEVSATPQPALPAAPTGLGATGGNAQVALSWSESTTGVTFNVYRGTSAGGESTTPVATGITGTTYTDTGLTNGTPYYYKVTAVNSAGTSGYSNEASATPNNATTPAAPTSLAASPGNAQVALSWTGSTGATSYNIYRGTSMGGESTTAIATGITGTTYTNTGLSNGTSYWYYVKAVNSAGTSGASNETGGTPSSSSLPDLVVTSISWTPTTLAVGSQVVFSAVVKNIGNAATPSGTIVGIQFAIDGNESVITWSDTDTTSLAAGASVTLTCNSGTNGVNYWPATAGSHTVQGWVDDVNRITESNENNNKTTAPITVP